MLIITHRLTKDHILKHLCFQSHYLSKGLVEEAGFYGCSDRFLCPLVMIVMKKQSPSECGHKLDAGHLFAASFFFFFFI